MRRYSVYLSPNPSLSSMARTSILSTASLAPYRGRMSVLKHVLADGRRAVSSPEHWSLSVRPAVPVAGRRSEAVMKARRRRCCSGEKAWKVDQKALQG